METSSRWCHDDIVTSYIFLRFVTNILLLFHKITNFLFHFQICKEMETQSQEEKYLFPWTDAPKHDHEMRSLRMRDDDDR